MKTPDRPSRRRSPEAGSAYLLVLLLLLVLTVLGLSLAVITQTEVQIGGAERTATRTFYGADNGLRLQFMLSRHAQTAPRRWVIDETDLSGLIVESQVDVSPFMNAYHGHCNLCSANHGEEEYWLVNYVTNAQARRISGTTIQASKLMTHMFLVQPEGNLVVDESIRVFDPEDVADDPATPGLEVIRY